LDKLQGESFVRQEAYAKVRKSYFDFDYSVRKLAMLAKLTSKNQLTLPKSITREIGEAEYFEVKVEGGQIILTPVKIQRADAVRAKLADLGLSEQDVADAVDWARKG
jgi:bifunctional DNA-binding transcriptional regulator/antitoxin component of YhaV-PrlF toxin-antitoxin module